MKKDYIVIGGKQYRVEVNWNALTAFLKEVGRDTIEELASFTTIHPSSTVVLTALDLGAVITPADVAAFMDIYVRQSAPKMEVDEPKKEEREVAPAR